MAAHVYLAPDGEVLGKVIGMHPATRVHIAGDAAEADHWHRMLADGRWWMWSEGYAITPEGLDHVLRDDDDLRLFMACATSFREFLNVWKFLDQDSGVVHLLGTSMWAGQETAVTAMLKNAWLYLLKGRQIGFSTLACAWDAHILRWRQNSRVHVFSREAESANDLLARIKFGLEELPEWMRLPEDRNVLNFYSLDAGGQDFRVVRAYPTSKHPSRGQTCTHAHLDEWAAMEDPKAVWSAIQPNSAACHALATGQGPLGFTADAWVDAVSEKHKMTELVACFVGALNAKPKYTAEFVAQEKARGMGWEYPEIWQDALSGMKGTFFTPVSIDLAAEDAEGFSERGTWRDVKSGRDKPRRYVTAWDIGGPGDDSDASVGIVLDVTEEVWDVVAFEHHVGEAYPVTAMRIADLHSRYPGITVIEDNSAGAAVRAFTTLREDECIGFKTTRQSKPVILNETKYTLQSQGIKWKPEECPQLDAEMRTYMLDDANIVQDCVMALAIAIHHGAEASIDSGGRILGVVRV